MDTSTKTCTTCKKDLPLTEFAMKNTKKGTRSSYCKSCQNTKSKAHYAQNKQTYLDRTAARNDRVRRENVVCLLAYYKEHPCVDCGEADPTVLEFDHRNPSDKSYGIANRLGRSPWETLLEEIAKCDVVCANCHRRRTAIQFGWLKSMPS